MIYGFLRVTRDSEAKPIVQQLYEQLDWGSRLLTTPNEYAFYGLYRKGKTVQDALRFLSGPRTAQLTALNVEPRRLRDKLNLEEELSDNGLPVVASRAVVGGRSARDKPRIRTRAELEVYLRESLASGEQLVIKPADGHQGLGVRVLTGIAAGSGLTQAKVSNGDVVTIKSLCDEVYDSNRKWLIQDRVQQHPFFDEFNKSNLSAIRLITFLRNDGTVDVDHALVRIGVSGAQTNSARTGAVTVRIDLETGNLARSGYGRPGTGTSEVTRHPGSDVPYEGRKVPFWEDVLTLVKDAASVVSPNRYVGWDVALGVDGPMVLEGNYAPSMKLTQTDSAGALTDRFLTRLDVEVGLRINVAKKPPVRIVETARAFVGGTIEGMKNTREMRRGMVSDR